MSEFLAFPKMPRLSRECIITEKIDGTNAQIYIVPQIEIVGGPAVAVVGELVLLAGSRTRWITPGKQTDNAGFAAWVQEHATELVALGPGRHYGEWWGKGIQRGYGLNEKRFSLFKWTAEAPPPACCSVVPVLYRGVFSTEVVGTQIERLRTLGSVAAPGFMQPEGVVVYHTAAGIGFKKTLEGDEVPKSLLKGAA